MSNSTGKRLDCLKDLIKTARCSKFSALKRLTRDDQDVFDVWDSVSQIIEYHMNHQKAFHVPGLGTFTFTSSKLDIGHNKFILIQRPVFVLSEKLARTHRLTQSKYHVPGEIPVIQLNFMALSHELNLDRDLVEASIREVVNALSRCIEQNGSAEFGLTTVGNLVIQNSAAKMKFLPSFLEQMDQTGCLASYLSKRPETSTSVLSNNSLILPKIQPGEEIMDTSFKSSNDMYVIKEEEVTTGDSSSDSKEDNMKNIKLTPLKTKKETLTPSLKVEAKSPSVQQLCVSTSQSPEISTPSTPRKSFKGKKTVHYKDPRNEVEQVAKPENKSKINLVTLLKGTSSALSIRPRLVKDNSNCDNCSENMTDFCYLCYQREKRNVPVYFDEQRKEEEEEEDRILQMYTLMKDSRALQKEEEMNTEKRDEAQRIASFNLGVSEKLKGKKEERPTDFHRSYVFRQRPITPPHYLKQENYRVDLAHQVYEKSSRLKDDKLAKDTMERVEQLQLADDLADQRNYYLKSKRLQSDEYRKALDTQVYIKRCLEERNLASQSDRKTFSIPRPNVVLPFQQKLRVNHGSNMMMFQSSELPAAYPDSDGPLFGKHDANDSRQNDRRKRARNLYLDQVNMTIKKRENDHMRDTKLKREEENMLKKTKADLLQETLARSNLNLKQRQDLEKTWAVHATNKRTKEMEEKLRGRSAGLLLQEQCDKYKKCAQCPRRLDNCGQSNVWAETRYVSGSRLII